MVETIRYSKIYADDIAFGTGSQEIELTGGEVVEMEELNITHVTQRDDNQVVYASSDASLDDEFYYEFASQRLFVRRIAGGDASADSLTLAGTTHATPGSVLINTAGGRVGIGTASPDTTLHVAGSAATAITIDPTGADGSLIWAVSGTDTWHLGTDASDSNKLKLGSGGLVGTNTVVTVSGADVGIGTAVPDGKLHVMSGASTSTAVASDADDIIAESNGDTGISIVTPNANVGALRFSRPSQPLAGYIQYDHSAEQMVIGAAGTDAMALTSSGSVLMGTTTTNTYNDHGLTVEQSGHNDHAISILDTTNVSHGVTDLASTTTYGFASIYDGGAGGLSWTGLSENVIGVSLAGVGTNESTSSTTNSSGAIQLHAFKRSGTGVTDYGATANILALANNITAKFLVKGDGDVYNAGGSTAMTSFDDHNDVQLLQTVKGLMAPNYRETLGEWVNGHAEILERAGVITRDGSEWYLSQRGWRGLLIDAIAQLSRRLDALES